jgi:hypothetical protein
VERPYSQSVADGIRIRGKTAGTGSELFEEVWEMDQTYSDAQLEKANSMAQLPNYDALARVLMKKPGEKVARNLYQFRLNLIEPSEVDEATKERKLAFVRQQADKAAKFTQEEIAEYVKAQIMSVDDASDLPRSVYDPY